MLVIVVNLHTIREFNRKKNRMFNFMSNIGSSNIIVKSLRVVLNYDLTLTLTLILPLYELFLNVFISKRLNKRAKLFFLIIPCRSP